MVLEKFMVIHLILIGLIKALKIAIKYHIDSNDAGESLWE